MIENLKGKYETVDFGNNANIKLYNNVETEEYPTHWHTPIEVIMPLENSYCVECCNQLLTLKEGDILIIASCCLHSLPCSSSGQRIIFQISPDPFRPLRELDTVLSLLSPFFLITPETKPVLYAELSKIMLEIQCEYAYKNFLFEAHIYSKFLSMLVLIGRNHSVNTHKFSYISLKQQEYVDKFIYICDYINTHCTEDLTLDFIANLAGFSKYHFSRLFKQFTNVSYYKYLNKQRIATAEKLLANPENTITDVATNSGFSSISSFIRMFKLIKNCTPTEFRNMHYNT